MSGRNTKRALGVIAGAFVVLTIFIAHARAQSPPGNETKIKSFVEPLGPGIAADQLFAKFEARITRFENQHCTTTQFSEPIVSPI